MSNDLWFRGMEIKEEGERRKNSKEARAYLEAMVLRTKPEANKWLHLTPRIAALGTDAFERSPVMIKKIHDYQVKEVNLAENAEEKSAEFVNRESQVTLEAFWAQNVKGEEGFDRTDSMLEGLGVGWTASFMAKDYPSLARYLIREFLQAVTELSIVEILFVTFGAENFVRGLVVLLTEGVQNLRLDGLLPLIATTHGNLGGLMNLIRYPEQMRENVRIFDVKRPTVSWTKIRDLRPTLIQYLLQQFRERGSATVGIRIGSATVGSAIFSGINISSNVQDQIPSAFRSDGCEKYENDRGSSLFSAEMRKTSENVRKILQVIV